MNWDTNEITTIIENNEMYYNKLQESIGNELYFMLLLWVIIDTENENEQRIDVTKVNGNEAYVHFCQTVGNEQRGWC